MNHICGVQITVKDTESVDRMVTNNDVLKRTTRQTIGTMNSVVSSEGRLNVLPQNKENSR